MINSIFTLNIMKVPQKLTCRW